MAYDLPGGLSISRELCKLKLIPKINVQKLGDVKEDVIKNIIW